jgi:hypothetical protein
LNKLFSARPVTIPGRAIGRITIRFRACCPKNLNRAIAKESNVPRIRAIMEAANATTTEVQSADRAPSLAKALPHHSVVKPVGGHDIVMLGLNELIATTAIGV